MAKGLTNNTFPRLFERFFRVEKTRNRKVRRLGPGVVYRKTHH